MAAPPVAASSAPVALDTHLKGHKDSVLWLAANPLDDNLLCSGSEDGTARIWDTRKKSGARCLQTSHKHPVNSVAFAPLAASPVVYCAEGHNIYCFDLRRPEIVLKDTSAIFDYNEEEINQIAVSQDGKFIAACDDTGEAKVIDIENGKLAHTLSRRHKNICTSVLFRPNNSQEVVTGGLDCNIVHWNIVRAKHLHQENLVATNNDGNSAKQTFNPPMCHSLSFSLSGSSLAAGLGDGSINVFSLGSWSRSHFFAGHSHSVSVVEFAGFAPETHLVSGSDDCTITLWDLKKNTRYNMYSPIGASPMVLQIKNTSKVNHLVSSKDRKLYVADQSNNVSVFVLRE